MEPGKVSISGRKQTNDKNNKKEFFESEICFF
jgi:hypothetical protein